ncbi:MAG: hypothetical protein JW974_01095 [Alphaproteobacteria bacterium]|nr:hypothetical protein [Alphaproteobacteria bacterium]MBN2675383.1 hypothetical protein [Alphaproteobacteria bacterium]
MKKLIMFFAGIILLLLTFVALYFSGALFDASNDRYIEAFVFQPNNLSTDRIGHPVPVEKLSDKFVRERLIKKFIIEYFYINPDVENIALRTRSDSVMAAMSAPDVFKDWRKTEVKEIEDLSGKKAFRTVTIGDEILKKGDYWEVYYELKTWHETNNMNLTPDVKNGIMYIKISFEKGIRDKRAGGSFDIQKFLENGGDPAAVFKFRVDEVRR